MGDGSGPALELLADAAQLRDELAGLADGEIGFGDLVHGLLQLGGNVRTAEFAEITSLVGEVLEISLKIDSVEHHGDILLNHSVRCCLFGKVHTGKGRHRLVNSI